MHDLLEIVVDNLHEGPLLDIHLHHVLKVVDVVVAIVFPDEIVKVHQELGSGYRTHEL